MGTEQLYFGLELYELLTLVGIIIGPIVAVMITLWVDGRRRDRDQKLTVLRMLLTTRHVPADPAYQVAVNLIPAEFGKSRPVMEAYKEFTDAVSVQLDGVNDEMILRNTGTKSTRLIYEIARELNFDIRETDIQTRGYVSKGWADRENTAVDSQRAMRDIANILTIQTRLLANQPLSENERRYIGITEQGS
jgi:hypothetical protein